GVFHLKIEQSDGSMGDDRGYDLALIGDTHSCETHARIYRLPQGANGPSAFATSDGGTILTYENISVAGRGTEPVVVRLDPAGAIEWNETLGTTASEMIDGAVETTEGETVVLGTLSNFQAAEWVAGLDANGQVVWRDIGGLRSIQKFLVPTLD